MAKRAKKKPIIGFIGLGLMGQAFSKNLIEDGHRVIGTDPERKAAAKLKKIGGEPFATPREVAEEADYVFISVPNSKISIQASKGKDGFLAFAKGKAPALICDTTTADPEDTRRLAAMCKKKRGRLHRRLYQRPQRERREPRRPPRRRRPRAGL